ncbi:MAG: rod shape-determining protein RodA [Actinomycetota bacterium]
MAVSGASGRLGVGQHSAARLSAKAPIRHLDPILIPATLLLTIAGCVAIKSASSRLLEAKGIDPNFYLKRQLVYFVLASIVFIVTLLFDYRQLRDFAPLLYGAGLLLLAVVLTPIGHRTAGAQRWIDFGILQIQPAEIMKVILLASLATVLSREGAGEGLDQVTRAMVMVGIPGLAVFVQPDLGSVMVLFAVAFGMLVVAGIRARWLVAVLLSGVILMGMGVQVGLLKPYQVARLTSFLDTRADPQRTGYNLSQSKIAIASGGWTGKGIGEGTQTNLSYVPEQHTDFIFTAIGEEQGFIGGLTVVGLFAALMWRSLRIAALSKDRLGTLLAVGVASMIAFQLFVNIGMTVGIMPITGIPLPFVSYGGSSLIASYFAVGLLMNIHMRRFT